MTQLSVLFICLGNICRSPLAEGVFRREAAKKNVADRLFIDSAATGGWHVGNPPDPRSAKIAKAHGIDITNQTCRQLGIADFHQFDFIFAMDQSNITNAKLIKPKPGSAQLALFTQFANLGDNIEIPDPYYGGADGFENAYQMIKQASIGALDRLFA